MRTVKPQRLGVGCRTFEHGGRFHFAVSALLYVPLHPRGALLKEQDLWPEVMPALGDGAALDMWMPKSRAEALLTGSAFPPGGAAPATTVRMKLGATDKRLRVIGDRRWEHGAMSSPTPFAEMPLGWARAFGGDGYAKNPLGRGFAPDGASYELPNVEDPRHLIDAMGDRPDPAGFGALDETWPQRSVRRGTYDQRWLETAFPGFAADTDWTYFNAAPADQWTEGYWRGDEAYVLEHLHPTRPRIEGSLPGYCARVFLRRATSAEGVLEELPTRLDTVHFFPALDRLVMIFRAVTTVTEDDAEDVTTLLLAAEDIGAPKPVDHYRSVLALRLDRERGALASLKDDDLIPASRSDAPAVRSADDGMAEALTSEGWQRKRSDAKAAKGRAEARARLEAEGLDPQSFDVAPPTAPQATSDDPAALSAELDQMVEAQAGRRAAAEAERAEMLTRMGVDPAAATTVAGGPPTFSAEAELARFRAQRDALAAQGHTTEDFDARLNDPAYAARLRDAEWSLKENYRLNAHRMPAAGSRDGAALREIVSARLAAGQALDAMDLTGADLHDLDLTGTSLRGALLEGANLHGSRLARCDLSLAVLTRADGRGADLRGARLEGANLGGADLRGATFDGSSVLLDAVFGDADLTGAVLRGACLDRADFMGARLDRCDLGDTTAQGLVLMNLRLREVNLAGARWRKCTLLDVDLTGADLRRVEWRETVLLRCVLAGVSGAGASLDDTRMVEGCDARGIDLSGASLRRSLLRGAVFERADFTGAKLDQSNLMACDLRGAKLAGASAREANFTRADLTDAVLRRADLLDAMLSKAVLRGTVLAGANLFGADLMRAKGDDQTRMEGANVTRARVGRPAT